MAFLFILNIALLIIEIFFLVQLTEVGIHVLNSSGEGFLVTGNPLAWIIVFALLCLAAWLIRLIFIFVNTLISLLVGWLLAAIVPGHTEDNLLGAVSSVRILGAVFWFIVSIPLTGALMAHFAANPQLNSWLADGSWLAYVLVYFGVYGLVDASAKSD